MEISVVFVRTQISGQIKTAAAITPPHTHPTPRFLPVTSHVTPWPVITSVLKTQHGQELPVCRRGARGLRGREGPIVEKELTAELDGISFDRHKY